MSKRKQGVFFLCTVKKDDYEPPESLPVSFNWIVGQLEIGESTGYEHWQICCATKKKTTPAGCSKFFGGRAHCELSRSEHAAEYCRKSDTAVPGTQFEFGSKPIRRNSAIDWESVWTAAKSGDLCAIPANVRVVSYRTLRAIASDHDRPVGAVRECVVYWGSTGVGKSRRAWDESGLDAYCKDPRSKFWCGYQGQQSVIIDEFRGGIDVAHLLRWLDRYPCRVEIKGSSVPLCATKYWITSNLSPDDWYKEIDYETLEALKRRMTIINLT